MAQTELSILLKVKDEASQAMSRFSDSFDVLKKGAVIAGGALLAAGGAAAAFGVAAVKAAAEAQVDMARFDNILKNTKGSSDEARKKILDLAAATTKLGFDDETTALSIAKLYQRTGDLTQATQLNSIAMDLARSKNIDLAQASDLVGMVLSGQGRALKQYGIELDENKKPMEALIELQGKLKGSAEAYSQTFQGQMEALQVQFGNIKETVGDILLPILTKLLQNYVVPLVDKMGEWAGRIGELDDWLKQLMLSLDQQTGIITLMKDAWDQVALTFNEFLMPALRELWDALEPLKPFLQALAQVMGGMLVIAIGTLVLAIQGLVQLFTLLLTAATNVAKFLADVFVGTINAIINVVSTAIEKVEALINAISRLNVLQGAKNFVGNVFNGAKGVFGVNDAIISPNGNIITTHPEDYLIATKNPAALAGGGMVVNINGGYYLSEMAANELGNNIIEKLKSQMRI